MEQMWGTLKEKSLSRYNPIPINDFCHVEKPPNVYRRKVFDLIPEMEEEFRRDMIAGT